MSGRDTRNEDDGAPAGERTTGVLPSTEGTITAPGVDTGAATPQDADERPASDERDPEPQHGERRPAPPGLTWLRRLYLGSGRSARVFRYVMLAFDVLVLGFFLITTFMGVEPWIVAVDLVLAGVLFTDFLARLLIAERPWRLLMQPVTWADLIVIVSMVLPTLTENYGFLRVLRALRLLRSYHILGQLRKRIAFIRRNEETILALINLFVFIFIITALVYVTQERVNEQIDNYTDALYFTIATLTTTGFGDITLVGDSGRLLAVLIMIFGISLFLRLVQTVFRPAKVRFLCPSCGLARHDPDAVHCKHCGALISIPNEGD